MDKRLEGKVSLITGGSRGLGKAMAIAFAKQGAKAVAITYVTNEESARKTCEEITSYGCTAYMNRVEAVSYTHLTLPTKA